MTSASGAGSAAPRLNLDALAHLGVDGELIAKRERLDGERALRFLADLPALAARCVERLGLSEPRIMPGGVLSAALLCTRKRDGAEVVLKLSAADAPSARAEAAALGAWEGAGACALLHASESGQVMLLEAIRPGTAVVPVADDASDIAASAELLATLHRIEAPGVPSVIPAASVELHWRFERAHALLDGPSHARGLISHRCIDEAHRRALSLHDDRSRTVLCHGDFTDKNILLDREGNWRAIDPRPCIGDPCLDAGFWALTHRPGLHVRERCGRLARARGLDVERVWEWAGAFAVSEAVLVTDAVRAQAHHSVLVG